MLLCGATMIKESVLQNAPQRGKKETQHVEAKIRRYVVQTVYKTGCLIPTPIANAICCAVIAQPR